MISEDTHNSALGKWTLLPCSPDKCKQCAVDHPADAPHDKDSMYYQYRFHGEHGRFPTWEDALAHCDDEIKESWEAALRRSGHWQKPHTESER